MRTVTLSVAPRQQVTQRALAAFAGEPQGARVSFETVDLLWDTLTRERWGLLKAMTGQGPVSAIELSKRIGQTVGRVSEDLQVLVGAGIVDRDDIGDFSFPYDLVRVDFEMTNAA